MDKRATLESIAPTIDEAIQKGLDELGLSRNEVDIEILDEGGSGIFGFGERQSRVRLTVKDPEEEDQIPRHRRERVEIEPQEIEDIMAIARATVQELLDHMEIRGEVETSLGEVSDELDSNPPIIVNITGNDLSVLIGRQAETLNALQLITRMIVGKEIGHSAHLIVDVEGYRERREKNLRQLAQQMADQAISSGRSQTLEPMTPAERRIIHIELRDHDEVSTESSGEDPKRQVVIIPV